MRVRLIKLIEIPDRFKPLEEDGDNCDEKLWDEFTDYLDTDPEVRAVKCGVIETIDGDELAEW